MSESLNCPTGKQWDEYLLGKDFAERAALTWHLENCGYCRLLVTERKRFLSELSEVLHASAKPAVILFSLLTSSDELQPGQMALAAKGELGPPLPEGATLASPGQEMLLKVLRDPHTHNIWLYLMADDPAHYAYVIVKPFDLERQFVTDANGRINLGSIDWPATELLKAEVHLPEAVFVLLPLAESPDSLSTSVLTSPRGDEIRVTLTGAARNRRLDIEVMKLSEFLQGVPLRVAIREPGETGALQVRTLVSSRAEFDDVKAPEKLEIYLFQ